ncbi:MAG: hypothetical protein HY814_02490 [Candidatus Riflebacteria bacterium]|nr:hypothetical protein [Candidatus Riflebacteria bacterium]
MAPRHVSETLRLRGQSVKVNDLLVYACDRCDEQLVWVADLRQAERAAERRTRARSGPRTAGSPNRRGARKVHLAA